MFRLFAILAVVSLACTVQLAPTQQSIISNKLVAEPTPASAPTPLTNDMTVIGSVRLRSAPDNTGSRTLTVIRSGETFHVARRTTVLSTEWAYGSWYNEESKEWMVGYVAARFLR